MQSEFPALFSGLAGVEENKGQVFLAFEASEPLAVATAFRRLGGRLITIAQVEQAFLRYLYEVAGRIYLVKVPLEVPMASIRSVFPSSVWHEAYLNRLLGVTFQPQAILFHHVPEVPPKSRWGS